MRYLILSFIFILSGCASVSMPGYIGRMDHPYERRVYGSFEKIVSSMNFILKSQGWRIINELDPAVYERDDRYDNNGYQNLLIMTDIRKKSMHLTSTHLNVFIHSISNICDVEVRYESQTSLVKRFSSARDDKLAQGILDALEQEVNR